MPDYAKVYLHNRYEVVLASDTTYTFSFLHFQPDSFFDRPFGIITAFNPQNNTLSHHENLSRNQTLYNELNSKYELLEVKGCYEGHCEEGYLIFDIDLSDMIELGRKYDQFAIFYNGVEKSMYVDCKSEEVILEKVR